MSEERVAYQVNQSPHARVPARLLSFLYRIATLKGGQVYTITLILPEKPDSEPQWAISGQGKVENGR